MTSGAEKKATVKDDGEERRIGLELDDAVSLEVAQFCERRPFVNKSAVRELIRDTARKAANEAVVGKVAEIVSQQMAAG